MKWLQQWNLIKKHMQLTTITTYLYYDNYNTIDQYI